MPRPRVRMATRGPSGAALFVAYYRVSTDQQGRSGLGLAAQKTTVGQFVAGGAGQIIAEFQEVESGKRRDRPQLALALGACRARRATLIIAKLDRLARDAAFLLSISTKAPARPGWFFVICRNFRRGPRHVHPDHVRGGRRTGARADRPADQSGARRGKSERIVDLQGRQPVHRAWGPGSSAASMARWRRRAARRRPRARPNIGPTCCLISAPLKRPAQGHYVRSRRR